MSNEADGSRRLLAAAHASELAADYDDARLRLKQPLLVLVLAEDSLGKRIAEQWLPRPPKWVRRARRQDRSAFRDDYYIFTRELDEVAALFFEAGVDAAQLRGPAEAVSVVVVAFEGVSVCHIPLSE